MDKKKIIIYTGFVLTGILLGWLFFGNNSSTRNEDEHNHSEQTSEVETWTCSMHPQIQLPEPGDCPICGMDLIPLDPNNNSNPLVLQMTEDAIELMNIETTVVGDLEKSYEGIRLSGKVISNETTTASIVSHIPGRIEKLYVAFTGDEIRKGQIIAKIYSPNLITAQKELIESAKIKDVNPSLFNATVNKLKYWKITDKQIDEILSSKKVKESFGIYAEHSGIVTNKRVSVGDHLMEGGVLFDIQNLNKLWVEFDAYESDLSSIQLGDKITFTTPSIPNKEYEAKITFIDPVINPQTRSASVRVEINNSDQKLKPEMFATGKIAKKKQAIQSQIFIPKSAVLWTGTRSVVYVKQKDMKIPSFEFREVTIGNSSGNSYLITEGLENGEEIVTKGAFVIDASAQLNNQSSMMNRKVPGAEIKTKVKVPNYKNDTPEEFKQQLSNALSAYYSLKDNLVASDVQKTKHSAHSLVEAIKKTEMNLLKGEAHNYWMKQMEMILKHAEKINTANDIEKQRMNFEMLSTSLINSVKAFGASNNTYVLFCPMAFDNKGAFWLSESNKIRNPYFGDVMLTCGSVKETIEK